MEGTDVFKLDLGIEAVSGIRMLYLFITVGPFLRVI